MAYHLSTGFCDVRTFKFSQDWVIDHFCLTGSFADMDFITGLSGIGYRLTAVFPGIGTLWFVSIG